MEADSGVNFPRRHFHISTILRAHRTAVELAIFVDYIFRERATKSILLSSVIVLSEGYLKAIHTFALEYPEVQTHSSLPHRFKRYIFQHLHTRFYRAGWLKALIITYTAS